MLTIKIKVDADKVISNLNKITNNRQLALEQSVSEATIVLKRISQKLTPTFLYEMYNSYTIDILKKQNKVIGNVICTSDHVLFVYFGTGSYAEMPHINQNPFKQTKSGTLYWFIPKSAISIAHPSFVELEEGYLCFGQKPNKFLDDAITVGKQQYIDTAKTSYFRYLMKGIV